MATTIETVPRDYPSEITGYAEPWIANPGENVAIKVSCTEPEYSYRLVRVIQGVDIEHSPTKKLEEIAAVPRGTAQGRFQRAHMGSYALVKDLKFPPQEVSGVEVSLFMQSHLPGAGNVQTILSTLDVEEKRGFSLLINQHGTMEIWVGTSTTVECVETNFRPEIQRWIEVTLTITGTSVCITLHPIPTLVENAGPGSKVTATLSNRVALGLEQDWLFAASRASDISTANRRPTNFFNGRLKSPKIYLLGAHRSLVAEYDFSRNISEDTILDVSGNLNNGVLVNAPTRAVTDHEWDGSEVDWTKAKYGYGAIHFHEDDLDDARWETDFSINLPEDARSGIYAVEVVSINGKTTDMVTFIVRPTSKTTKQIGARVALVLSTFTYLAYANEKLADPGRPSLMDIGPGFDWSKCIRTEDFHRNIRRQDCGLSHYDQHRDGSGVVFSSAKRPILNFKPGYIMWAMSRPRELSAESMMIGFLEQQNIPYDVITDHDLHVEGITGLTAYNTLITGCHPEYPSTQSYNAYENFARRGGNLMYLGGNGFYWVTALDKHRPWRLEVRRGDNGVRAYALPGGEQTMSLDGVRGALWRTRGRSSHGLFGVAFCAEGAGPGCPFKRTNESFDPKYSWIFDGIDGDIIGEYGLGGGASGDEVDSFDIAQGSPRNAVVIASSTGHSDEFGLTVECANFPLINTLGTQTRDIRSDMVFYETNAGGAVFSVGSINWFCSVGWDNYENNVARLTENVIRGFLARSYSK